MDAAANTQIVALRIIWLSSALPPLALDAFSVSTEHVLCIMRATLSVCVCAHFVGLFTFSLLFGLWVFLLLLHGMLFNESCVSSGDRKSARVLVYYFHLAVVVGAVAVYLFLCAVCVSCSRPILSSIWRVSVRWVCSIPAPPVAPQFRWLTLDAAAFDFGNMRVRSVITRFQFINCI